MKLYTESPVFGLTKQGEVEIKIRFQPKRLIAISLVLFMHALLLFLLYTVKTDIKNEKKSSNPITLIIEKVAKTADKKIEKKKTEPKPIREKSIKKYTPPVLLTDEQRNLPLPPKVTEEPDMMSMLNAARERRKKAEETAQAENQAAQEGSKGLSAQQIAAANINRSMQQASNTDGTNGVFQIVSKSTRMGMFTFRGWKVNSNGWKQTIEVDAGLGGNIDLAMVRKMIEIIRTHYKADFKWESQRLGRVVTLSARLEDSTELENFMLEEFPEFAKPRR
jgi:hypothetical protein